MANTFTSPVWVKSKPHASAEKQVGDSDPSARTDIINRVEKGIYAALRRFANTFFDGLDLDLTDQTTVSADTTATIVQNYEDARTNTVARPITVQATTSGSPAANIGTGILIRGESADEAPSEFAALDAIATAIGAGAENTDLVVMLRAAGAALAERARIKADGGIIPGGDPAGTPAQHGLYRANVIKAWGNITITPTISDSFNVASVADGGAGVTTVTIDRDFANSTYAPVATCLSGNGKFAEIESVAVGSFNVNTRDAAGTLIDTAVSFMAVGDQ